MADIDSYSKSSYTGNPGDFIHMYLILHILVIPVEVTTSQFSLPKAPSLNPPGSERFPANWTGFSFQIYSTSLLAQPSAVGIAKLTDKQNYKILTIMKG